MGASPTRSNVSPPAKKAAPSGALRAAVQLHTVRDHIKTRADLAKTFLRIGKIGYRGAQIGGPSELFEAAFLKDALARAGLQAIGHGTSLDDLDKKFGIIVDFLHAMDIRYTGVAWMMPEYRDSAAAWKKTAALFNRIGKRLSAEGIALQYHNHDFEFENYGGKAGLRWFFDHADPQYVQGMLDTAWIARGYQDPAAWITRLKGRMDQIHIKDTVIANADGKTLSKWTEIGGGNLDWPGIFAACKKAGVRDLIVEQDGDWLAGDPFQSLKASYRFLNQAGIF